MENQDGRGCADVVGCGTQKERFDAKTTPV